MRLCRSPTAARTRSRQALCPPRRSRRRQVDDASASRYESFDGIPFQAARPCAPPGTVGTRGPICFLWKAPHKASLPSVAGSRADRAHGRPGVKRRAPLHILGLGSRNRPAYPLKVSGAIERRSGCWRSRRTRTAAEQRLNSVVTPPYAASHSGKGLTFAAAVPLCSRPCVRRKDGCGAARACVRAHEGRAAL